MKKRENIIFISSAGIFGELLVIFLGFKKFLIKQAPGNIS
jgi:hypothetical protein